MDLLHFRMLIHELLNKDPDIVPEAAPIIILYSKSDVCMAKNGNDTKHIRHIARRVHFVRNGESCKFYKIEWCEGILQLEDVATNDFGDNNFNHRMKYIMASIYN